MKSIIDKVYRLVISIIVILFTMSSESRAQSINEVIEQFDLSPQMISYHPEGEWIMSTRSEGDNPYLLIRIDGLEEAETEIDTLEYGYYLNVSKLSNDGDQLLYGFLDTLVTDPQRRTYLRTYENGKFGKPVDFREKTGLNALTYFMIDETGNVFFYTYSMDPKGIYKIGKDAEGYGEPELLIANRPNFVPFSPLLLDENTMLLAQHGQSDQSVNGIYVSKKENDHWSTPKKLEGLPYGWSLGFGKDDAVVYLIAETKKVKQIPMAEIRERVNKVLNE